MRCVFKFVVVTVLALFTYLPGINNVEAAGLVLLPLYNNTVAENMDSIYYDCTIDVMKESNEYELKEGDAVDKAIAKHTSKNVLPSKQGLIDISTDSNADMVVAMELTDINADEVIQSHQQNLVILKITGRFMAYNVATGKIYDNKLKIEKKIPEELGARWELTNEELGRTIRNEMRRVLGIKKFVVEKQRISKSGFKGDRR